MPVWEYSRLCIAQTENTGRLLELEGLFDLPTVRVKAIRPDRERRLAACIGSPPLTNEPIIAAGVQLCGHIIRCTYHGGAAIILASMLSASFEMKYDFVMDEQTLAIKPWSMVTDDKAASDGQVRCILVVPKKAAFGSPWSWKNLYQNHQPPADPELLARGFHLAYITPGPLRQRDAWRAFLAEKHRLSRKPIFVGMSRTGELRAGTAKISITPEDVTPGRP